MARWRAAILAVATLWAVPADAAWHEASSDHFLIYANASETWVRAFAERLERYDAAMRVLRDLPSEPHARSNRLTIYAVSSQAAVVRLHGGRDENIGGFYIPRAGGSIAIVPRDTDEEAGDFSTDVILFHEYAHQFMLENYPGAYPIWFVEGFAEFSSATTIKRDGSMGMGMAANHRALGLLRGPRLPIEQLLEPPPLLTGPQWDVFYGRAWLLTHMLTFDPARKGQLSAYLRLINEGQSSLAAAKTAFGDLKVLQRDLERYLKQSKLSAVVLSPDRIKPGPIAVRRLSAGEAAAMAVRMRSDRGVSPEQALKLLPDARRAAAPFPNDAGAQAMLAEAEYDAGNDAACVAAADRAIAADPKKMDALLYKGRARTRMAEKAGATDPQVWKEARSWFVKANRLDPNAAEPLMLFYTSFLAAKQPPSASSVKGLEQAYLLSPHDRKLRMLWVARLLEENRTVDARKVLLPLAYAPHAPADNPARKLLAEIDSGKPARELVAMAQAEGEKSKDGAKPEEPQPKPPAKDDPQ